MDPRILESIMFRGSYGSKSVLSPIGYQKIEKHVRKGCGVHLAQTQFTIHSIATEFYSELLLIPRVYSSESNFYVMDHAPLVARLRIQDYRSDKAFFGELCRFFVYMFERGYYPYGFTIGILENGKYLLFDFSEFGHVQGRLIKFKFHKIPLDVEFVEKNYGILYFHDLFFHSHVSVTFDPDEVVSTPLPANLKEDTHAYNNRPTSSYGKREQTQYTHQEKQMSDSQDCKVPASNYEEEEAR
jgi:hypothetical protein